MLRVIDTLREKFVKTFEKTEQFALGPTFALAAVDRLGLPAGAQDILPYYPDAEVERAIVSGVLWNAAYGRPGSPVFRGPGRLGAPNLESHLSLDGCLVDLGRPFQGVGLIVLERTRNGDRALGLLRDHEPFGDWHIDQTMEALSKICELWNNESSAFGGVAHPVQPI